MMRLLANKKNVKIVSVVVAAVFVLGVAGLAFMQMNSTAMASPTSNIGVIDPTQVVTPDSAVIKKAQEEMQNYSKEMQAKFEKESANADDAQKQKLLIEAQQQMQNKQMEIQKNIEAEVRKATEAVAEGKGLSVVLNKEVVLYGGTDITPLVAKKFNELTNKAGQ